MFTAVLSAAAAFAASNIDDLFMLLLLFSAANRPRVVAAGYCSAVMATSVLSLLGAGGLQLLGTAHINLLGLIPLAMAVFAAFSKHGDEPEEIIAKRYGTFIQTVAVTLAGSADNIGIYIPLFVRYRAPQHVAAILIATLCMAVLWCRVAKAVASLPSLEGIISRRKKLLVPLVYAVLGLHILLG